MHLVYKIIQHERENEIPNGLYKGTQVGLSYNSNRIEGSTITYVNTEAIFEKDSIYPTDEIIKGDDVIETKNHFLLFSFMLDTINEPLTEKLIKEYQQLLKRNTTFEHRYGSGKYKEIPNTIGNMQTAQPYEVTEKMKQLILDYHTIPEKNIVDLILFHGNFEKIHPFQDGNGRVGRMIMFRECLKHTIDPFIIEEVKKTDYYNALNSLQKTNDYSAFVALVEKEQAAYLKMSGPFMDFYKTL